MSDLAAQLRALQSTIGGADVTSTDARSIARAHGFLSRDVEAIGALAVERLLVYRRLVRKGMRGAIRAQIPLAASALGASFDALVDAFSSDALPASHYLRDVAFEFVAHAASRAGKAPFRAAFEAVPFALELARHELATFEIATVPSSRGSAVVHPIALEAAIRFDTTARLLRYEHAVHEVPDELPVAMVPARRSVALFAHRGDDYEVCMREVDPLEAQMLDRLLAGDTLAAALAEAARSFAVALSPEVLDGVAGLLADLGEAGALFGAPS